MNKTIEILQTITPFIILLLVVQTPFSLYRWYKKDDIETKELLYNTEIYREMFKDHKFKNTYSIHKEYGTWSSWYVIKCNGLIIYCDGWSDKTHKSHRQRILYFLKEYYRIRQEYLKNEFDNMTRSEKEVYNVYEKISAINIPDDIGYNHKSGKS